MMLPAPSKATPAWLRLETWAVIAASAMVLAVVAGAFPHVSW
jgi:hypothetical protein